MILKTFVVSPFATNCYLLGCEESGTAAIIDPGDQGDLLLGALRKVGLTLESVLLTHGHIDHVGAVGTLLESTGARVYLHHDEAQMLETLELQARLFSLPPPDPVPVHVWLGDGDQLLVGSITLRVLHTPGHTPGSVCFHHEGILFSGDTLFRESVGRTDWPGGSHRSLISSIRDKILTLPDEVQVLPGHGEATTIGDERCLNPFL